MEISIIILSPVVYEGFSSTPVSVSVLLALGAPDTPWEISTFKSHGDTARANPVPGIELWENRV